MAESVDTYSPKASPPPEEHTPPQKEQTLSSFQLSPQDEAVLMRERQLWLARSLVETQLLCLSATFDDPDETLTTTLELKQQLLEAKALFMVAAAQQGAEPQVEALLLARQLLETQDNTSHLPPAGSYHGERVSFGRDITTPPLEGCEGEHDSISSRQTASQHRTPEKDAETPPPEEPTAHVVNFSGKWMLDLVRSEDNSEVCRGLQLPSTTCRHIPSRLVQPRLVLACGIPHPTSPRRFSRY